MDEKKKVSFSEKFGPVLVQYSQLIVRVVAATTARFLFMGVGLIVLAWALLVQVASVLQEEGPLPPGVTARNPEIAGQVLDEINRGRETRVRQGAQQYDSYVRVFGVTQN